MKKIAWQPIVFYALSLLLAIRGFMLREGWRLAFAICFLIIGIILQIRYRKMMSQDHSRQG